MGFLFDLLLDTLPDVFGAFASSSRTVVETRGIRVVYVHRVTRIEVDVPASDPLALLVRRWGRGVRPIAPIHSDDARFDRGFSIDGAPADIAPRVLDAAVRRMLECRPAGVLSTHRDGNRAFVRLTLPGQVVDDLGVLVDTMARIPRLLRAAYEETGTATPVADEVDQVNAMLAAR